MNTRCSLFQDFFHAYYYGLYNSKRQDVLVSAIVSISTNTRLVAPTIDATETSNRSFECTSDYHATPTQYLFDF